MTALTTVVLVESSYLLRAGIENLLAEFPGLLLRDVFDGTEKKLSDKIKNCKPELVIINCDINPQILISLVNTLNQEHGIVHVGLVNENTPLNIRSRFSHVLNTNDGKFELLESFRSIIGQQEVKKTIESDQQNLTARELTILKNVALGLTNQQIADELFLSIHTVMTHRKNITKKLGIKTVSGLIVYALMNKLIVMGEIEGSKR